METRYATGTLSNVYFKATCVAKKGQHNMLQRHNISSNTIVFLIEFLLLEAITMQPRSNKDKSGKSAKRVVVDDDACQKMELTTENDHEEQRWDSVSFHDLGMH